MAAIKTTARSVRFGASRATIEDAEASADRSPFADRPIEDVWAEYAESRSTDIRNYLIERFLPLVKYNAERIHQRLPDEVDIEDLMSAGLFGLMDAIDAYDLDRQVKFETYCAPRIRGAILDELRSMDWVPRLVRHRTAKIEQARQSIQMQTGHIASEEEIAQRLGVEPEEFDKVKRDGQPVSKVSISRQAFPSDGNRDVREIDVIKDETQTDPLGQVQRKDVKDLMTKGLSRAEQLIVTLYYYESMTMKEIGATLDLSESRVSQMHSSIVERLKAQMRHRMRELESIE